MPPTKVPPLNRRRLGRSELMVTELGLGAMDTPQSAEGDATLAVVVFEHQGVVTRPWATNAVIG